MRNLIYTVVETIGSWNVNVVGYVLNSLIVVISWIGNSYINVSNYFFFSFLKVLNKERTEYLTEVVEQSDINGELQVLFQISLIKKQAFAKGTWTEEDAAAFNQLGSILYSQYNWSTQRIQHYFRNVLKDLAIEYPVGDTGEDDKTDLIDPPDQTY